MPSLRAVVVGSSNTDLVVRLPRLPGAGESILGGAFEQHAGGKGANQAVALARAGFEVSFVGAHGGDDFGRQAVAGLRKEGIDVKHFRKNADASSGIALILIGGKGNDNMIGVAGGANSALQVKDVQAAKPLIAKASVVVSQLEVPLPCVFEAAKLAQAAKVPFVLNPAPAGKLPPNILRRVHTLVPNETEATLLTGESDYKAAARELRARGCKNVVVTLGSQGAYLLTESGEYTVPAPRVKALDTVGAGDCFCAWLAAGISEGLDLPTAAKRACRAASIAVTRSGAQKSMPKRAEVLRK